MRQALQVRIFSLPRSVRRIGIQAMRFVKVFALFFAIAFALAAQSQTNSPFCSMRADRSIAVKSKANFVTKIAGDINAILDYFHAEH